VSGGEAVGMGKFVIGAQFGEEAGEEATRKRRRKTPREIFLFGRRHVCFRKPATEGADPPFTK